MNERSLLKTCIAVSIALLLVASIVYAFSNHGGSAGTPIAEARSLSSWSLQGGGGTGALAESSSILLNGEPSIAFGTTFARTTQNVTASLNLSQVHDFSKAEYLIFWVFAENGLQSNNTGFFAQFQTPFKFSLNLTSADGSNKTYGNYSINWQGWRQFALPLSYNGTLIEGTPRTPIHVGVTKSASWRDEISLKAVTRLSFTFTGSLGYAEKSREALYLAGLATSQHAFNFLEVVDSVVSAAALFSVFIVAPVYLLKFGLVDGKHTYVSKLKRLIGKSRYVSRHSRLIISVFAVKAVLATLTPLSSDFIDIINGTLPVQPNVNPIANSPLYGGYMDTLTYLMYRLWLLLPVDHLNILQIFPGNYFRPTINAGILNFPSTPGSFLLVLLLKTPNIFADLLLTILIYEIIFEVTKKETKALAGATLWLVNPYNTLIIEMWSNFEVLFLLPLITSLYLLIRNKHRASAAALGFSLGVRLWATIVVPFILSAVRRAPLRRGRSLLKTRAVYLTVTGIFAIVAVTPFVVTNYIFPNSGVQGIISSDTPDISLFLGLRLQLADYVLIISIALLTFYLLFLYDLWQPEPSDLPTVLFIFFLLFFALARWLPHWLLWIMPFLAIDFGVRGTSKRYPGLYILGAIAIAIVRSGFYFSSWGNSVLFFPNLNSQMTQISQAVFFFHGPDVIPGVVFGDLLQSALVGISIMYLFKLYQEIRSKHPSMNANLPG